MGRWILVNAGLVAWLVTLLLSRHAHADDPPVPTPTAEATPSATATPAALVP